MYKRGSPAPFVGDSGLGPQHSGLVSVYPASVRSRLATSAQILLGHVPRECAMHSCEMSKLLRSGNMPSLNSPICPENAPNMQNWFGVIFEQKTALVLSNFILSKAHEILPPKR